MKNHQSLSLDATSAFLKLIPTGKYKDNADLIKAMEGNKKELEAKLKA